MPVIATCIVLLSACGTSKFNNLDTYVHPEYPHEENAIFAVGVAGPNPVHMVRICANKKGTQYTTHRRSVALQPGEVYFIEQPRLFDARRLCTFSYNKYEVFTWTEHISKSIKDEGPGIYYLGTIKSIDDISKPENMYTPEILDVVREELARGVKRIKHLKPINFKIEQG